MAMITKAMAQDLDARHGVHGAISFRDSALGGVVAELRIAGATAAVALRGGQVLSYVPRGGIDALWLSPMSRLDGTKAVRGGIPVCWPWFGPHPSDPGQPAHGFVRRADWHVISTLAGADSAAISLAYRHPDGASAAPWRHLELVIEVRLGTTLDIALTTRNCGDAAMLISQALHTYFRVGDVSAIGIDGFDGCDYIDKLDMSAEKTDSGGTLLRRQRGPIAIAQEIDRIYLGSSDVVTVSDPILDRRITVANEGSASTVVWNPWIEKAARLGDLGPDGHHAFVCVETANADTDRRIVAPGGSHLLRTAIAVAPL